MSKLPETDELPHAAEGQPVDEVEEPRSIEERRRVIHEQAQQALGEMKRLDGE